MRSLHASRGSVALAEAIPGAVYEYCGEYVTLIGLEDFQGQKLCRVAFARKSQDLVKDDSSFFELAKLVSVPVGSEVIADLKSTVATLKSTVDAIADKLETATNRIAYLESKLEGAPRRVGRPRK